MKDNIICLNQPCNLIIKQELNTYRVDLEYSRPASQDAFVIVHCVAKRFPIVLWLVVVHFTDIFIRLAGDRDGVGKVGTLCKTRTTHEIPGLSQKDLKIKLSIILYPYYFKNQSSTGLN